ncbi:MAG: hypothetical protein L3J88_03635 [Gammaproteobacteria bacterium]|nr:hypothetical protein [Gammaproteobacteria bacterium]
MILRKYVALTKNNVVIPEGRVAQADPLPEMLIFRSRQLIAQAVKIEFSGTANPIGTQKTL